MNAKKRIIIHTVLALIVLFIGAAGFRVLKDSRQALGRQQPEVPLPLVRTAGVSFGDVDMIIRGEGNVKPVAEIQLIPQVGGKVIHVSPDLVNGGTLRKGDRLVSIEPADYEIAVTLAEAGLKDARSRFETAAQEAQAAANEWRRLNSGTAPPPLVAREPQLDAARANLEAQRASLEKARLDLARTTITAPFNGRVSGKNVDVGQFVSPGQSLATLYSTDDAEIVVPLEGSALKWIDVPGFTTDKKTGSEAIVRASVAGRQLSWTGEVVRVEGRIDEKTRMVNAVIRVPEPYSSRPPLAVGQFAEVSIKGMRLEDAAVIPRAAVRDGNTVWAVDSGSGRMYFKKVDIARMDARGVVIRSGLEPTDRVVISQLKTATDGMQVRAVDINGNDPLGKDGRSS